MMGRRRTPLPLRGMCIGADKMAVKLKEFLPDGMYSE
jgi:hypothetical protein